MPRGSRHPWPRPAWALSASACRRARRPRASPCWNASAPASSPRGWSGATSSWRWAAASSAISPASPPRSSGAACASFRPDDLAGAGRQLRRRQDRDQYGRGQESRRRLPPAIIVLADTAVLDTLPAREFRAGYAEVVKYGLLGDRGFFDWLEGGAWREVFAGGPAREEARSASAARPRPPSSPATRRSKATARSSTSATPSAMRWRLQSLRWVAPRAWRGDRHRHGAGVRLLA